MADDSDPTLKELHAGGHTALAKDVEGLQPQQASKGHHGAAPGALAGPLQPLPGHGRPGQSCWRADAPSGPAGPHPTPGAQLTRPQSAPIP